jgi:hypothetical protein
MRQAKLCLHTGGYQVEREQLAAVITPERTRSWVPIAHHRLLDTVRQTNVA